jgi:short-subunit dehydrogenase
VKKVIAITGASSGIGHSLALRLAQDGDRIALLARRKEQLESLASQINDAGGHAEYFVTDVADQASVQAAFAAIESSMGPIDTLVANAGIGDPTPATRFDSTVVERIIQVNLVGVSYCIEAVLPSMLERKSGHIVGVGSLAGYRGLPGSGAYCASKAGVASLLESLRIELRGEGIQVSTICPGFVKTPLTGRNRFPMPFLLELNDATNRIARAIRAGKTEYAFPWQLAFIVRLSRFVPNWLYDRALGNQKNSKTPGPKSLT